MSNFDMVLDFHDIFCKDIQLKPTLNTEAVQNLRIKLIQEEFEEVKGAIAKGDIANLGKELADLLYVVYGAGAVFGLDLDTIFKVVHKANLTKLGEDGKPIFRESDGKVLKGPNYVPAAPVVEKMVYDAMNDETGWL